MEQSSLLTSVLLFLLAAVIFVPLGKRFGAVTRSTNKGLLVVHQQSLLLHIIRKFKEVGIQDTYVVAGYQRERLKKEVGSQATIILNPFYSVSGILGSFWMARQALKDSPFLFTTSDHYFESQVLAQCLGSCRDVCVVVQKKKRYTKEDAKVILKGDEVVAMEKDLPVKEAQGEFGGMVYFSQKGARLFFKILENTLEKAVLKGYVMDILNRMRDQHGMPIHYSLCFEGSRIEIDSVYDLIKARKLGRRDEIQV